MKRIACGAVVMLAGAIAAGSGCDDAPEPPPHLVADQPPAKPPEEEPARPTTQELLTGPRRQVVLGEFPLTVQAPQSWAVNKMTNTTHVLLQGPTPSGEATIQLNDRPTTSAAKLEMIVNGARKELQQFPQSIKMADLRQIGGAQVLERQRVGEVFHPSPDDPDPRPSRPMNWTITVFVPRGADYDTYELNFVGLTAEQYETDEALLRGIINSIAVRGSGGGGGGGGAATSAPVAGAAAPAR